MSDHTAACVTARIGVRAVRAAEGVSAGELELAGRRRANDIAIVLEQGRDDLAERFSAELTQALPEVGGFVVDVTFHETEPAFDVRARVESDTNQAGNRGDAPAGLLSGIVQSVTLGRIKEKASAMGAWEPTVDIDEPAPVSAGRTPGGVPRGRIGRWLVVAVGLAILAAVGAAVYGVWR